jgi:hypothetical protein
MRRSFVIWILLASGCAQPASVAPAAPAARVASGVPIAAVARSATGEPEAIAAPASKPNSCDLHMTSPEHDFRLILKAECTGSLGPRGGCTGAADLLVSLPGKTLEPRKVGLATVCVHLEPGGEPVAISTNPDDEQGTLVVGDFNFDGREDFAVHVGDQGPYGSPTYAVFLAGENGQLHRSAELSKLTEESLGLFQVDRSAKRLVAGNKSGCCIHETEQLEMINDKPVVVLRLGEDASHEGVVIRTREQLVKGRWKRETKRYSSPPDDAAP